VSAFRPGEKHHVLNTNFPRNVIGKMNGAPPRVDLSRMRSLIEIKQSPYCHAKFAPGSVLTFNIHRLNWWCFADRILRRTLKEDASLASFTCLAVSENAGVVSLERIVEDIPPEAVENDFLRSKPLCERIHRTETMVERKTLWLFPAKKNFSFQTTRREIFMNFPDAKPPRSLPIPLFAASGTER
jgi:hypothetical protein